MFLKCPTWLNRCLTICVFFLASFKPSALSALNPHIPMPYDDLPSVNHAEITQLQSSLASTRIVASSLHPMSAQMSASLRQIDTFEPSSFPSSSSMNNYRGSEFTVSRERSILAVNRCPTPMSLMLHSSYGTLRMQELAQHIVRYNLTTSTYRQILKDLQLGKCPEPDTIIVSLDDLGSSWLRPEFKYMIKAFTDRELVLVVGVIVHGPQDPAIWTYLRGLEAKGIEVASHTIDHYNLPQIDQETMVEQVAGSYKVVCENLGRCPVTLILPFGNYDDEGRVFEAAKDYTFIVGIQGGQHINGFPPFYLGRIPPENTNQAITLYLLRRSFNIGREPRSLLQ